MNNQHHAKSALRKRARENICDLSSEKKLAGGTQVAKHIDQWLTTFDHRLAYKTAGLFKSFSDEISTAALRAILEKHGIAPAWPLLDSSKNMNFEPQGPFDIIFIPGLAFDRFGHRLGRGEGYYDRYLSGLDQRSARPILVGLCLDEQFFESVPIEAHDVVMDYICTPTHGMQKVTCE